MLRYTTAVGGYEVMSVFSFYRLLHILSKQLEHMSNY